MKTKKDDSKKQKKASQEDQSMNCDNHASYN